MTIVKIDFDQVVTLPPIPAAAFQLKRQGDNAIVGLSAAVINDSATHVTLTFTGALADFGSLQDGRYTLTVFATSSFNAVGSLDGNGDGTGGDDYTLIGDPATNKLFRLFGDANGSGNVDATDFGAFRAAFGTNNNAFDFDNDGDVDASDFGAFRQRFGVAI